jgi:hypothetical protein
VQPVTGYARLGDERRHVDEPIDAGPLGHERDRRAARRVADDHDRPFDPGHRLDHGAGVVLEHGRRIGARQVDGDRAVAERLELGDHRRGLGRAARPCP